MDKRTIEQWKNEITYHLTKRLLPSWLDQCWNEAYGGSVTQFDTDGRCEKLAKLRVRFALDVYWDEAYGGFYWLLDRRNHVIKKLLAASVKG